MNVDPEVMREGAAQACALLKALANEDRLLVLCNLAGGEKNVSELQGLLEIRQPTLSQQLARLRLDGLVEARREGKEVYYRVASNEAGAVLKLLYELYCPDEGGTRAAAAGKPVQRKARRRSAAPAA